MSSKHKTVVKAMIHDDQGRLLLVMDDGYWDLPGGNVEQGEALTGALARELEEELGLTDIKTESQPAIAWTMSIVLPDTTVYKLELDYVVATDQVPKVNRDEVEDLRWFTQKELEAYARECDDLLKPLWEEFLSYYKDLNI